MTLPRGTRVGSYELLSEVGRGGSGAVFQALGPDGRAVALKFLLGRDPVRVARFERERRLLASLGEAEGFVPLLDSGTAPWGPFIVMPYVEGGTLRARLAKGPLPVAEARALGIALARALGHAHAKGIVHRDLKPANILFTRRPGGDEGWGRPLVADLGVAKHFDRSAPGGSQSAGFSASGTAIGTFGYMAPEQLSDSKNVGPPADVFALGAIIYECLAGTSPFPGDSVIEVFAKITSGEYRPVRKIRAETPADLAVTLDRALATDPSRRFPDGASLARALSAGRAPHRVFVPIFAATLAVAAVPVALLATRSDRVERAHGSDRVERGPSDRVERAQRVETPAAKREYPPQCRSFLSGPLSRLTGFWGDYAWHHAHEVEVVAWSADGDLVLSGAGTTEKVLRAWRVADGAEVWNAPLDEEPGSISVSEDGRIVAVGLTTGAVLLHDVATGQRRKKGEVAPGGGALAQVAFLPGGTRLVYVRPDAAACIDAATGAPLWRKPGAEVLSLAVHPDGRIASSDRAGTVVLASPAGDVIGRQPNTGGGAIAFSPDGTRVACADAKGTIALRDAQTFEVAGQPISTGGDGEGARVHALAFVPGTNLLVAATRGGDTSVWNTATGAREPAELGVLGRTNGLAVSRDGTRLALATAARQVAVCDLPSGGRALRAAVKPRDSFVPTLAALDRGRVALGAWDGSVRVVSVQAGKTEAEIPVGPGSIGALDAEKNPGRLVVGTLDGQLLELDLATRRATPLARMPAGVAAVAVSHDSTRVALGTFDGGVAVVPLSRDLPPERPLTPHGPNRIDAVAWSSTDEYLVSVSGKGTIATRSTVAGRQARSYCEGASMSHAACSPAGPFALVIGAYIDHVQLWDLEKDEPASEKLPCARWSTRCAWLDARHAAVAGFDETIRILDTAAGKEIGRIDLSSSHDFATALAASGGALHVLTARSVALRFELELPGR